MTRSVSIVKHMLYTSQQFNAQVGRPFLGSVREMAKEGKRKRIPKLPADSLSTWPIQSVGLLVAPRLLLAGRSEPPGGRWLMMLSDRSAGAPTRVASAQAEMLCEAYIRARGGSEENSIGVFAVLPVLPSLGRVLAFHVRTSNKSRLFRLGCACVVLLRIADF